MKPRFLAAFDIGTTAVKGVLSQCDGTIVAARSVDIPTLYGDGTQEQDPQSWWEAFRIISLEFTAQFNASDIIALIMSGQMQDLIPLDANLLPVGNAILYSDGRAKAQSQRLEAAVGADTFLRITGNRCDASLPLPKLMWLREERPEQFQRIAHVLISSKDYLIARLTGVCCGDMTACSTAGAMDLSQKIWSPQLLAAAGVSADLFPTLLASHQLAGRLSSSNDCGYVGGTPIFVGIGDAGATSLASGISDPGQYNINLGTSGWVATVSHHALLTESGVFNLAAAAPDHIINVVPFLNAGNVHNWACRSYAGGDYSVAATLLRSSSPGSHGVLFLPYLSGERFPVLDPDIRGSYVGITPETTPEDLTRAALEGVAYSLRQGFEHLGTVPSKAEIVSLIGGGSQEPVWCQILADVLNCSILVFQDGTYLPSLAVAAIARLGLGQLQSYGELTASLRTANTGRIYQPDPAAAELYRQTYPRYCRLYPALQGLLKSGT